jgi:hypothetical protein
LSDNVSQPGLDVTENTMVHAWWSRWPDVLKPLSFRSILVSGFGEERILAADPTG